MAEPRQSKARGRGSQLNPPNRFEAVHAEDDLEHFEHDPEELPSGVPTVYLPDDSQSIVTENHSPDVPFRYSLNPYRGCAHGCSYCYARPTHEYLGLNAGLDFESKILVKHRAAELFREWLARPSWHVEPICFSGVTDCYQPIERRYRLTRSCLEVALDCRQPIMIVTKNALVTRDLDLLAAMAQRRLVSVAMSVTSLDAELARTMEPRTSAPQARCRAIGELASAGVPVSAMLAPIIPGLNDVEIPRILEAAAEAGARHAGTVLLRLPHTVLPVFLEWLQRTQAEKKERIESRIRSTRGGKLSDPRFGSRMRGEGAIAEQIRRTFKVFAARYGLDVPSPPLDTSQFRPPVGRDGQMRLF